MTRSASPSTFETPGWTEFATEGATLALHAAERPGAPNPQRAGPEAPGTCRPGLSVPDLAAFHKRMLAANVPCPQPPKSVFGTMIAQYLDPDGLAISVSEQRRGT